MNKIERMKELVEELNKASAAYYNGSSIISDQEFDLKLNELKLLEKEKNTVLSNSPTINVGTEVVSEINKVTHSHPMLSLDKCHQLDEIQKFMNKHDCIISVKMDGLTISAEYNDGVLTKLESRGNGIVGQDVMVHRGSFVNLPHTINKKGKYVIDGECIITYDDFNKINSELSNEDKFSNPRNLASGTLSLLDSSISKKRFLRFVAWNVIDGDESNDFAKRLINARDLGFTVVPFVYIDKGNVSNDNLQNALNKIKELAKENEYPMDGAVISQRDVAYGLSLGKTEHHFLHSIAYKYEDEVYPTKMKYIDWTMGKSGILTPTAVFEPVEIDGSIVERASLHNISVMNALFITKGCTVYVYKANMIIPQIHHANNDGNGKYEVPKVCPICGELTKVITENSSSVLMCTNDNCKGKLLGKLELFASKEGMNIDGLSTAQLQTFIDKGWLNNIADVFDLKNHENEMRVLSGFGKKSVDKLLDAIEKAKNNVQLSNFIRSLGIPLCGKTQSKIIANQCHNNITEFTNLLYMKFDFSSIDGIGEKRNSEIYNWFSNKDNKDIFDYLLGIISFEETENKIISCSDLLKDKTFVVTGSVTHFKNRNELSAKIEELGGKVSGSVSKNTDYLINNDIDSTSGKNAKAKSLGVPIISEEDFLKMINE